MALSNESGQAAYKNANPKINGEIIQAAQKSEQDAQQAAVESMAKPESELPELDKVLSRPTANISASADTQTLDEAAVFPTGGYSKVLSFTDRISMLGKTGKLNYPEYRTLSQQQRTSYEKAMSSPEYQRLAQRSFEYDLDNQSSGVATQVKNELVRYAGDLLSFDRTELWLGNMAATGDWSDLGSMGAQAASWLGGKLAGAAGLILDPTELGDDTLKPMAARERYDYDKKVYNAWVEQGLPKEQTDKFLAEAKARFQQNSQKELMGTTQTPEIPLDIPEDTKVQTIGKNIMNAALRNLEYKAAVLPQGTPYDREAFVGKLTGGALSMGELLLAGVGGRAIGTNVGRQVVRSGRATPAAAARFEAITGREIAARTGTATASRAGIERVAQRIGGESGSAASLGLMTNDIMGGGAFESVRQYIEETGDTDLSEYQGDLKKVAIDAANATIQNWIEHKWGVAKFIKNPRLATKYGEWVNGFIQEFTQGEVNDFAEYIKGNQTAKEVFENVASNAEEGLIGALLQGATGTAVYHYNHTKSVADLRRIVMAQNPNISYAEADRFAERKVNELEENMVQDIAKDVVQFTDAQAYQGAIYEVVRANIEATINAQREAVKDTIDGSKFDEMSEQERAQYISQVAADEVDRITIAALESGIPLSEVPQLRGNVIDGTFYLEGSDYAKRTAAEAQARREEIRRQIFESRENAKRVAEEARQAARNERLAADIAAGRERAARIRQERETATQMKESDARLAALEKSEQAEQRQIAKWEKEYARQEAKRAAKIDKTRQSQTRVAIRGGNVDQIRQILSDNGYRTRDLSGTAIKNLALLNWELFEDKSVGESAGKYDRRVAQTAIEQNVESGNDVLHRAGFTDEQIGRMDDATWERAILAAYKTENASEIEHLEKQEREIAEAIEQIDVDDLAFQDVETESPMDLANENARLDDIYPAYTGDTINIDGVERTVYNSNGDRIAQSEPALRNFWAWFGNSKVVDKKGRPLVVYHGTGREFDTFDYSKIGTFGTSEGLGFYTTENLEIAQEMAALSARQNNVRGFGVSMPLYVSIQNPITDINQSNFDIKAIILLANKLGNQNTQAVEELGQNWVLSNFNEDLSDNVMPAYEQMKNDTDLEFMSEFAKISGAQKEILQAVKTITGYDGAIIQPKQLSWNSKYPVQVSFSNTQIKSVYNRGTFGLDAENVFFQTQNQSGKGGAYDARNRSITLGARADATTLPHELAHYWIDKNFKWARSGNASQAWLNSWRQVEKWLGIDPEDKVLDNAASEKFARGFERFLADEKLPLIAAKSMADFRDFVADHYDFDLDDARGLQDKFGRPIKLDDATKDWFRKTAYAEYMSPDEALVIDNRLQQIDAAVQVAERIEQNFDKVQQTANAPANDITRPAEVHDMPSGRQIQTDAGITNDQVIGRRKIGGGKVKESQGQIGQKIGATYESTTWEIQRNMVKDYLAKTSLDDAIEALDTDTYPQNMDANFLRAALVDELNRQGREDEAVRLVLETRESLTEAAQTLQAARAVNTPFENAINQIVQLKAEKLARAKFGNNKNNLAKLDAAIDKVIAKYEPMFLEAQSIAEIDAVYDALMADAARTIGTLNKNAETDLFFQTVEEKRAEAADRKKLRQRGSVKAYRSRAKALLKQKLGLTPTKAQIREISRLASEVSKVITKYRAQVRAGDTAALDPSPVLKAQNDLNNYLAGQVGSPKFAQYADALNSYMMANMLWNPATQFKNLSGNAMQLIPHLLGSMAKYRNTGTISFADKKKILQNAVKIQAETGYNVFSLTDFFDRKTLWAEKYYEPETKAGKFIRAPLTLLGLTDTIFKGFTFLNHADIMATAIARGEAKQNGWNAEQTAARAKELFYQSLNTDPSTITLAGAKIRSEAIVEGEEATYTQSSAAAKYANQFRKMLNFGKQTGIGNLLIPFTSTTANIAQDAVANWTFGSIKNAIKNPAALLNAINPKIDAEMRKDAWKTIAPEYKNLIKNAIGILLLVFLGATMGDDDDFVLDYNLQTEKDKDIRQNRNAPNGTAVRIGDKWVQLDILASGFLPMQTYLTARRHGFTTDGWIQGLFGWRDLMPGVGEMESLVKDYNKTLQYNKDSDTAALGELATDQATEFLTRLVPMGALVNQIGNITDDTKREKYNHWYDRILGRIPGLRNRLPEQTSRATGKPIPQTDNVFNLFTGGNIRDYIPADAAAEERYRFLDADRALRFNEASSRLKELGKDSKEYKAAVQEVRRRFNEKLAELSRHPVYKAWDLESKRKAAVDVHSQIVDQVANKYGIKKKKTLKKKTKKPKLV